MKVIEFHKTHKIEIIVSGWGERYSFRCSECKTSSTDVKEIFWAMVCPAVSRLRDHKIVRANYQKVAKSHLEPVFTESQIEALQRVIRERRHFMPEFSVFGKQLEEIARVLQTLPVEKDLVDTSGFELMYYDPDEKRFGFVLEDACDDPEEVNYLIQIHPRTFYFYGKIDEVKSL